MKKAAIKDGRFLARLKGRMQQGGLYNILVYIILIDLAFVFLYPFIYMLVTSLKSYNDITDITVKWYPRELSPQNWKTAFETLNFSRTFFNSLFVSLLSTLGHLISCSFVAYGFARYKFPLKKLMFFGVLLTIVIPVQSIIIPQYRLYVQLGIEGYWALILPTFLGFGLRGGLFIFLFRQFFLRLPTALEEAAEIDGTNPFGTFLRIILPSSGPIMLVCFVLSMVWHWNDYYEPSLYLTDANQWLLPQALPAMYNLIKEMGMTTSSDTVALRLMYHDGVVMAGTAIAVLPLLILYLCLQNKFVESIDRTGIVE